MVSRPNILKILKYYCLLVAELDRQGRPLTEWEQSSLKRIVAYNVYKRLIALAKLRAALLFRRRKRRWHVRPIFRDREIFGAWLSLIPIVRESDPEEFYRFLRMTPACFDWLLERVQPYIEKKSNRKGVSGGERLAVTLSQTSLSYIFRLSNQVISNIVTETTAAIWFVLKPVVFVEISEDFWKRKAAEFQAMWDFPMCNGAIDGKHCSFQRMVEFELYDDDDDEADAVLAVLLIDEEERDSDDGEEILYVDVEGYRRMSNSSFKTHFRMDRITFQRLISTDTYRAAGLNFGKRKGVIKIHYCYVIDVSRELAPRFIKWPNAIEKEIIKAEFEERYGYPGAVGCIDGVHMGITAPLEQKQAYFDRHHNYSMLVQAVCDHRLLYMDVYVGQPGAIGDIRNYDRSPLSSLLLTDQEMMTDEEHLLGNGAYILTSKIIIPYADDGHLTDRMKTHNRALSACRVKIENSIAVLRAKHRRLKHLPMRNVHLVIDHIMASFMIHNFIILEGIEMQGLQSVFLV
ncbi:Protein ANTAGONIST OF LIKE HETEROCHROMATIN PROTEIN 1 [Frankliniella fusca]|uniref:Protein ANTAGONIST OF LIKE HETEROCHROMATIN PROTEIN 1 n=1 Tax=Frankliniella fusca TaxID=407009 RepID=A0AAE1LN79_9NEOP|nr:Protein ANTAGONIST OF LIKE HETEROCHROMATIN PROTEIN 1 [Frankliniella fusca]